MSRDARRIPVAGPSITEREVSFVADAVANAWYEGANVYHRRFEEAFAAYVGRRHAMALPSCTSALHLSLLALGIGAGDEVAIPDITWIASAAPITYVGATPVFVDVDPQTWCIDVQSLRAAVTERTRAVVAVDLYGGIPDMAALTASADELGLAVIEDAAEAIGSRRDHACAGSFGAASTFSFHGSKTLTTGEGGMLVTDDDDFRARCDFLRDHGRDPGDKSFRSKEVAYKYKMSSMQAALGLAQLERIDELIAAKRTAFGWYRDAIDVGPLTGAVTLNAEPAGVVNSYWMVTAILSPELNLTKEVVIDELGRRGIDSRPFFDPLSSLDAYRDLPGARIARERNAVSYRLAPLGINLPSSLALTERDVAYVCRELADVLVASRAFAR